MKSALSFSEICLFFDVDGTLIDLAPRPTDVVVPASLIEDLAVTNRRLQGALALVSGRTILDLDRLFHPLRLKASGVHGAEFRFADDGPVVATAVETLPPEAWSALALLLHRFPGTLAENKTFSFAVHYRAVPDKAEAIERALDDFLKQHEGLGLRIMAGHYVFEMKRPSVNKGAAIECFLGDPAFAGRRPIFFGDDVTDRPGFATVLAHGGLAYGVGMPIAGVTDTFADPQAVRRWLADMTHSEICTA